MGDGINRKIHGVYNQAEKQGIVFRRSTFLLFREAEWCSHVIVLPIISSSEERRWLEMSFTA